ncbi:TMEM165/GDT1 family protein [Sinanaerobacter chloroacetimidivorans]|uniref:GDT1 family protein n=1 Tax=Sinanaerobacter chloroacetimidivorans TaxID=2818044 RepID=A0A8J7W0X9_9FIRM|nr:TMEM165/GDT1 family protein [Sinanaerobacter chloroacetimidivorans]MBR0597198.1 TMEM165/GDT1 family protein [Sinanaerobacter chloroacetimidivorans]
MYSTLIAFLFSVGAVTLAEMGDKTQLLAMAFAAKYKASKVLLGVFLATVLNHAMAVALGNFITRFESLEIWIQSIAALSFIFFGLWTIRGDKLEGEENRQTRFGAVMTVAIAFFIAELGDKTQLATIALAAKFPAEPIGILMGTTTGMLIADSIGIVAGVVMCRKIPEKTIKLVSAGVFILFGFIGFYQVAVNDLKLNFSITAGVLLFLLLLTALTAFYFLKRNVCPKEER